MPRPSRTCAFGASSKAAYYSLSACYLKPFWQPWKSCLIKTQLRHGSRINTDQFTKRTLKLLGGCADMLPGKILDLNSLMSPFLGFWVIQTRYWPVPFSLDETSIHFPDFNLESVFIKSIFIIKNLTDFRNTVVTSVDPRLQRLIK